MQHTKVILHCRHSLQQYPNHTVTLRSPPTDTDILVLAVALLNNHKDNVILDTGSGKSRKVIPLNSIVMDNHLRNALIGFHAFTGNDYVSSFFRKGKFKCWQLVEKYQKFQRAFTGLGLSWTLSDELFEQLEECVHTVWYKTATSKRSSSQIIYEEVCSRK